MLLLQKTISAFIGVLALVICSVVAAPTLVLEHERRPTATYNPGDAFLVEAGKIHQGINTGNVPVKLVATLMTEKGKPASTPVP
jgi:quercetin dioxygenase-like cupin family protein